VLDTEEVLVEPLDQRVRDLTAYVGAAIMADGRVSLVLNMHAVIAQAMAVGETLDLSDAESGTDAVATPAAATPGVTSGQCLVALVSGGRRIALPMDQMARLETFAASRLEHLGGREVVQYRGAVVPVLRLGRYLERRTEDSTPTPLAHSVPAVVYTRAGRTVALAVDEIVDIVPATELVELESQDPRISGGMVLQDQVTELVQVDAALAAADPSYFDALEPVGATVPSSQDEVA
jgi:two-component system chemotaxis sensor kinase CheA